MFSPAGTHIYIYLSIYLSYYQSIHLSHYLSLSLSLYPSIHPSIHLSIYLSISLSLYPPIYLFCSLLYLPQLYIISPSCQTVHFVFPLQPFLSRFTSQRRASLSFIFTADVPVWQANLDILLCSLPDVAPMTQGPTMRGLHSKVGHTRLGPKKAAS